MRTLPAALAVFFIFGTVPASAAIRITDARYENGVLIIAGDTAPNQDVTLDGKYQAKADGGGHFQFREAYKPATCMSDIASGGDSYSTIVTNCLLDDATAALKPAATATPSH
jgi:hypothetical protein